MNFREVKEANKLINEIKMLDSLTMDAQNSVQYQTIEKQKERIRELQEMKQLKEIYG
uniref:Uncharacterized protein n=1 Tax=Siphoviridae sp. ct8eQ1 TaxID=2826171 RepID=A0A8S5MZF6_9CAUD|nr:MAG TPA: hypothetical protein [Siphoviridae sp. ct8eQ1]